MQRAISIAARARKTVGRARERVPPWVGRPIQEHTWRPMTGYFGYRPIWAVDRTVSCHALTGTAPCRDGLGKLAVRFEVMVEIDQPFLGSGQPEINHFPSLILTASQISSKLVLNQLGSQSPLNSTLKWKRLTSKKTLQM